MPEQRPPRAPPTAQSGLSVATRVSSRARRQDPAAAAGLAGSMAAAERPTRTSSQQRSTTPERVSSQPLTQPGSQDSQSPEHSQPLTQPSSQAARVVCPLSSEGCSWSHTQQHKLAQHLNEQHVTHWTEPFVQHLYINIVLDSCSNLRCCGCGRFYNNTQHGRNTHRGAPVNCSVMSENDSWARHHSNNASALPDGLRMEPFGEAAMDGEVLVLTGPSGAGPTRRFRIVDCGHKAGNDHHCCLYKAYCGEADDAAPEAVQLKAKVTPMATAIARSRGRAKVSFGARGVLGEEECHLAIAHTEAPVVVVSLLDNKITGKPTLRPLRYVGRGRGPTQFLYFEPGHYQQLVLITSDSSQLSSGQQSQPGTSNSAAPSGDTQGTDLGPLTQISDCTTNHWMELHFDGGAKGNPGPAAGGWVLDLVTDANRSRIVASGDYLGKTTNNVAEYAGFTAGMAGVLDLCEQHALPRLVLRVFGDSKLVVNQMLGKAECRARHLQPHLSRGREIVSALQARGCRVSFKQVPRGQNKEADAEANLAINARASHTTQDPHLLSLMCALRQGTADELFADPQDKDQDKEQAATVRKALRERLVSVPPNEELEAIAKELHLQSRPLHALPPARLWPAHFTRSWLEATQEFTAQLKNALDDGSELATMQIVLDLSELTCRVFLPLLEEEKHKKEKHAEKSKDRPPSAIPDPLPNSERVNPQQDAAKRRAYEDLWAKAMQTLLSNGVAPANEQTLQQMADMHIKRTTELKQHAPGPDKVTVTTEQAKSFLYKEAGLDHTCMDVFGWATDFLFPVRNTPFLRQVARLCARVASADVPDSVAQLLTCGGLLALHKESPKQQADRAARGLKPKLRPVNIGSALLKWSFKCALRQQAPQDTAKSLKHQLGLGAERGVERMAHLFTALWNKGYAILGIDFENGFNAMLRQAMLDAVHKRCSMLTPLVNKFYARDSLCFFVVDGEARVVLSQEGSRMGCVLGSFAFDCVVEDIYEGAQALLPEAVVKALTDDLNTAVPPQESVQEQLRLCGQLFTAIRSEAERVAGLAVNMDKTKLLLPLKPDGQPHDLDALAIPEDFPAELKVNATGMKVGGAPVGTDAFVHGFVADTLEEYKERVLALPGMDPQVGYGLLRMCVSAAPVFLSQVTPPMLTGDLFAQFDDSMVQCGMDLLALPGHAELACSEERCSRARRRMQLPLRHKGGGITASAQRHPIAYFSSVASSASVDELLAAHIDGLTRVAADTHERVLRVLGPPSRLTETVEELVCRADPLVLLKPQYFVEIMYMDADEERIQRRITTAMHAVHADRLHQELATRAGDDATQDLVAACSADFSTRIFSARLSDPYNRLKPPEFVCFARRFLQLPPLARLGNGAPREGYDYDMEWCLGGHAEGQDAWLDLYGSHDNGNCAPTMQGKHKGHTLLKWTIDRFARKVPGVHCVVEPKTHEVLLGQFSEAQCRKLFPKLPSKKRSRAIQELVDELDAIRALPPGAERDSRTRAAAARMDALNTANFKEEKKAVRLDVQLRHGPDELLIDATITHSLGKSHRQAEAARTWERLLSDIKSVKDKPAAAIEEARRKKFQTYNPLLYVIKKQVLDGRRQREPKFTPAAVTTFGELGPGCTVVQEWLAERLRRHLENEGERPDGAKVPYMVGKFRADFKLAVMMTVARRAAAMQLGSGLPSCCVRGGVTLLPEATLLCGAEREEDEDNPSDGTMPVS